MDDEPQHPRPIIATVVVLVIVAVIWASSIMQNELARINDQIARTQAAATLTAESP